MPTAIALVLVAGFAHATVPDSSGMIHGCYANKGGALRVINTDIGQHCTTKQTALSWQQRAPLPPLVCPDCPFDSRFTAAGNTLAGAYLPNAQLSGVSFPERDMTGINLRNASIVGTNSSPPSLANWTGVQLAGASFHGAAVSLVDMSGADVSNADLGHASVDYDKLTNANLTGADLTDAYMFGTDMTGANITGVTWNQTTCPDGTNSSNDGGTCAGHLSA